MKLPNLDVELNRDALKDRSFLLGNKRAFALALPAASGASDALLHRHKWFGAYLYGRKFLEGQLLRVRGQGEHLLTGAQQRRFTMGLTSARRDFQVEGRQCSEEFFVADGIQGFVCTVTGDMTFVVEPEFDMRFYRALNETTSSYEVEEIDGGVLVSNLLPAGDYDDASETFVATESAEGTRIYAAALGAGSDLVVEILPLKRRSRRKVYRKDAQRERFLLQVAPTDAQYDHAPLWNRNVSEVYAPVRFHLKGHGSVVYGFGSTPQEAIDQAAALRDNLIGFQAQKIDSIRETLEHARFETHDERVDTAYAQVLSRLMDALVARHAVAEDTALDQPATMILAGNQYFHDSWKRDENIALGFLLSLGFYDLARNVIRDTWQLQDPVTGRLPQRIRAGEAPPYHSSDGTLWALLRLYQYWRLSGDESLIFEKLSMVRLFFDRSVERAVDGMLPSGRTHAPDYLWETWMDTPHTPRDGFPVEVQLLWIACLRNFRRLIRAVDGDLESRMARAEAAAWQGLQRFNVRGVLADSLDLSGEVRDLITPNPYFSFGLGLDLGPEMERTMRDVGRRQLAGHQGIITLAPTDWERVFSADFLSDRRHVRGRRMKSIGKFNYHRGVEWNWLSQFFVHAELKYGEPDVAFRKFVRPQVDAALDAAGVGGISELFDLSGTRGPEFQAWSMAGFLEALHAFAGVRIDVPDQRISVEPQIPDVWPQLSVRKWYGTVPFDVLYSGDTRSRSMSLEFPWGDVPEATIDLGLWLPPHRAVQAIQVCVDGEPYAIEHILGPVPGTPFTRLRITLPAHGRLDLALTLKRAAVRATA